MICWESSSSEAEANDCTVSILSSVITKGRPYRSVRVAFSDGPVLHILCAIILVVFIAVVIGPKLRGIITSYVRFGNGIDTLITALRLQLVTISRNFSWAFNVPLYRGHGAGPL